MGSSKTLSPLTLSDLERLKSRSLRFRSIISLNGAGLTICYYLTLTRKNICGVHWCDYIWSESPSKANIKVTQISKAYIS